VEFTCLNLVLVWIYEKKNYDRRRIPTYLLANLPTLIIKELRISVEQGTMVATLNLNKH
jgi:hypothetical protein